MALHVTRLTLYKHGLGFFERSGQADASFGLDFPRRAIDDVLKSLTVLPTDATVESIAFETPPDRNPAAQRQPMVFDANRPLSSVLDAFVGRHVAVTVGDQRIEGELVGLEREDEEHIERALLSVLTSSGIRILPLRSVTQVELLDEAAKHDLAFALEAKRQDLERAVARVKLSAPSEVDLSYIAPAPAWRVSYRVLVSEPTDPTAANDSTDERNIYLQGWGIFDNTLEEDLADVALTLTAGMPVSFRYSLHQPNTPDRPFVHDQSRTVSAPIEFSAMASDAAIMSAPAPAMMMAPAGAMAKRGRMSEAAMEESVPIQATGEGRGALFAYRIATPVSVRRGESAMVPIVGIKAKGRRELLFNSSKSGSNPVASVRFKNDALTLERGPAIILESGDYAGESIVAFTPEKGEVILAFAVELGVSVSTRFSSREETRSVRMVDGSLLIGVISFYETTYTIVSQLAKDCVLTIEHNRRWNSELVTTSNEESATEARFRVSAEAGVDTEFTVIERQEQSRYESVLGIDGYRLAEFARASMIDEAMFRALTSVLERQARVSTLEQEGDQSDEERERIRGRLDDTRKNLETLDATHDSSLRARFIAQLETLEDRMSVLDADDDRRRAEIDRLQSENSAELDRLSNS